MSILPSVVVEPDSHPFAAAPPALASVLVIDDEEMVCRALKALLKAKGFDVVTALSGEEGVELLRDRQFEVVICDLVMAGMNGIRTIAALKEVDPDVEVIILTGHATVESTIAALRQGACDFLLKPIDMEKLRPALNRALEKRRPKAALPLFEASRTMLATLNRENLIPTVLDLAEHSMRASTAALALTPFEGAELHIKLSRGDGLLTEAAVQRLAQEAMQARVPLSDPSFVASHSQGDVVPTRLGSVLVYPLEVRNAMLGALVLWRDAVVAKFSAFDVERGRLLADQIVIALDNARLYRDLSHKVEELEAAKGEVARAEDRARAVMETTQEAIIVSDKEGVVWDLNPKAVETLGWARGQAVGRDLADFAVPPRLLDDFRKHLETAYREGKNPPHGCMEVHALRQNGKEFPMEIWTAVIETPQGKLLSTFCRDITQRKEAERQISLQISALNATANGIVITDQKGQILWANPAFTRLTGYAAAEVVGQSTRVLKSGAHDAAFYQKLWNTIKAGEVWQGEVVNQRKDGTLCTEEMTITPVRDGSGVITHFIAIKQDITQRKRADEALRENEEKYRVLYESSRDAIMMLAPPNWQFIAGNPAAIELFGAKEERKFVAITPWRLSPEFQPDGEPSSVKALQMIGKAMRTGSKFFEWTHMKLSGEEFLASVTLTRMNYRGQQVLQASVRDITERKRAEEKIRASEARFRELFENASDLVYTTDLKARLMSLNNAGQQLLGYLQKEAAQLSLLDLVDPKHWSRVSDAFHRLLVKESDVKLEMEVKAKDGRQVTLEVRPRLIYKDGHPIGVQGIARDITGRDVAELELRHAQKLESVGRLASGIAHEINTPIQFVGDNARFLKDSFGSLQTLLTKYQELRDAANSSAVSPGLLEAVRAVEEESDCAYLLEEIPKALAQTIEGVTRVATIVRAMKEFAHPESKAMTAADLNKALLSTLTVARNELKYVADVETDFGDLPLVFCNIGDLNQVFLNLLVNAAHTIGDVVKGTGRKGTIRVRTAPEEKMVLVAISDTGAGIPEAIRNRIFDPFFTTKEVGRGTGQGLAISRSVVVERHKGTLTFETEAGKGTTFYVRLPVDPQEGSEKEKGL